MNIEQQNMTNALGFYVENPCLVQWYPLGKGHINQTFLVNDCGNKFVLQCINHHVFPNPQAVVNNAVLVNDFLVNHSPGYPFATMSPIKSRGGNYFEYINNSYWRAFEFVADSISLETIEQPQQAYDTAFAFATFCSALVNLEPIRLSEVINNFHDLDHRVNQLQQAVTSDIANRASAINSLITRVFAEQDFISLVAVTLKRLPLRTTHNDTKINNLLFNKKTMEPLAIIDLDTCMSGYLLHDFGDMVRTCCSNLGEDATEIEQMAFKQDVYDALYQGYIAGAAGVISPREIDTLPLGARLMPFLLTLRFLTDYLEGDKYFNIYHPSHNLDRAINQFQLYQLVTQAVH